MWNQFLQNSQSQQKFDNSFILILGNRHTGKRTLIDGLCEISKTVLLKKKDQQTKIRDKSLVSAVDYAYVNVVDLNDPQNKINSKLQVYLVDQDSFNTITELLLHNPTILSKLVIMIALDSTQPWTFAEELDKWVKFINQLMIKAQLSISKLDELKQNIENCFKHFKQPQFDKHGKSIITDRIIQNDQDLTISIPQDILVNNIRIPLIVTVTKSDLQASILRQKVSEKISFIQYYLRKFCLNYGGSLIYVSNRNHTNLIVLYQYIIHRVYGFPLRFKSDFVNEDSIFIPLGSDNFQLLNDSIKPPSLSFNQMIPISTIKKQVKKQIQTEDENEFYQKLGRQNGITLPRTEIIAQQQSNRVQPAYNNTVAAQSNSQTNLRSEQQRNVRQFYDRLLSGANRGTTSNRPPQVSTNMSINNLSSETR